MAIEITGSKGTAFISGSEGVLNGVTSFNGRTGSVSPQAGDYTASQVGAITESDLSEHNTSETSHSDIREIITTKQDKITSNPQYVAGFDESGSLAPIRRWSSQNILLNWYFCNPVNRNGKTEYAGPSEYFIDRWKRDTNMLVTLTSEGLELWRSSAGDNSILQPVECWMDLVQRQLTLSVLAQGTAGTKSRLGYSIGSSGIYDNWVPLTGDLQLITYTFTVPSTATNLNIIIRAFVSDSFVNEVVTLKAAKLELGSQQTLAHQDTSGNWILNDLPDYALQYALCSLYSPITNKWMGTQHSNQNLFDNWYLADPVNQKNMTEYTEDGYTIDRWKASGFSLFKLSDSGITIAPKSGIRAQFQQIFEDPKMFYGREFTYSFFVDGQPYSQTVSLPENPSYPIDTTSTIMDGMKLYLYQASATSMLSVGFRIEIGSAAKTVFAAKLEFCAQQTIAHQDASGTWVLNDPPPNKALELAKCQRYQYVTSTYYGSGESDITGINIGINFPCTMRSTPTMQVITGVKAQMAGHGGSGFYEDLTASFRWGSNTSCSIIINNPDPSKFIMGYSVTARIDTPLLFDANL